MEILQKFITWCSSKEAQLPERQQETKQDTPSGWSSYANNKISLGCKHYTTTRKINYYFVLSEYYKAIIYIH